MTNPRIISGKARGTRLKMVPGDITRPITDMVKEALFNILGMDIYGATFLDMFGGTGSVGIEALSRGANFCRFIDLHRAAVQTIRANLELTHLQERAQVLQGDAFTLLSRPADRKFDYIFIAPPQYKGMWEKALVVVDQHMDWLSEDGWVIVQIDPVEYSPQSLENLEEFEQRRYGNTMLIFYERKEEPFDSSPSV